MKQLGRAAQFGCLALVVGIASFFAVMVLGVVQQSQSSGVIAVSASPSLTMISVPSSTPSQAMSASPSLIANDGAGMLIVVTVVQPSTATAARTSLAEPSPSPTSRINSGVAAGSASQSATPTSAPLYATPYQPFFSGQTLSAQSSATAMLVARTAWHATMTQGAINQATAFHLQATYIP